MRRGVTRRGRSGITLTEILIAIMIMGVGLISLATLFPLGLMRMRDAMRANRSALLTATAESDLRTRNLLGWDRFRQTPYYQADPATGAAFVFGFIDPWVQDTLQGGPVPNPFNKIQPGDPIPAFALTPGYARPLGAYKGWGYNGIEHGDLNNDGLPEDQPPIPGPGLPVAYDPLWRKETNVVPNNNYVNDGRFAVGVTTAPLNSLGRDDPSDSELPSAFGLQRLTNFPFGNGAQNLVIDRIFVSPDDILYQESGETSNVAGVGSPLVPDLSLGNGFPTQEFMFSWMFTGQRVDSFDASVYSGDIVIFHNRPLSLDPATGLAVGERVVEGVFAFSTSIGGEYPSAGYSRGDARVVLLRWPRIVPDPEVRVGSWIADVTYERRADADATRFRFPGGLAHPAGAYPGQRCHWYRVVKVNPAETVTVSTGDIMRQMTVVLDTPVRAKTLLNRNNGDAYHLNAALVSPYVVNVFPVTVTSTR